LGGCLRVGCSHALFTCWISQPTVSRTHARCCVVTDKQFTILFFVLGGIVSVGCVLLNSGSDVVNNRSAVERISRSAIISIAIGSALICGALGVAGIIFYDLQLPAEKSILAAALFVFDITIVTILQRHFVGRARREMRIRASRAIGRFLKRNIKRGQESKAKIAEAIAVFKQLWTFEVVKEHVDIQLTNQFLIDDPETKRPVLRLQWSIYSVAPVPCEIILEGGTCQLFTLPVPGEVLCTLKIGRIDALFDGTMYPNTIIRKASENIELSDEMVAKLVGMVGLNAVIRVTGFVRLFGRLYEFTLFNGEPLQKLLSVPPSWATEPKPEPKHWLLP
jgi:hypothetical protein